VPSAASKLFLWKICRLMAPSSPWYEIDLSAIRHNHAELRKHLASHVKVFACLKRNAYGCGAGPAARVLAGTGVYGFGVASLSDASAIRAQGIELPILLYAGVLPDSADLVHRLNLTVTVSSLEELEQWSRALGHVKVFLKVDLGFFRAGVSPARIGGLLAATAAHPGVELQGIYTHTNRNPGLKADAVMQFQRFQQILQTARAQGLRPPIALFSSTHTVLEHPEMDLDAVDPGALFFGIEDAAGAARRMNLKPALKAIKARLVSVKQADDSLGPVPDIAGYRPGMTLGVIAMGWGHGYPRKVPTGAQALVRGVRVSLLAPAHLEHMRVDLSPVPDAVPGDEVFILGAQGGEAISIESLAAQWGLDPIGLYVTLRDQIPRTYIDV
jgi:alanine racemase